MVYYLENLLPFIICRDEDFVITVLDYTDDGVGQLLEASVSLAQPLSNPRNF